MKHVRNVENYKIKNVFKKYNEEEEDRECGMGIVIKDRRKKRKINLVKEGDVFDLVKGVTEEYEIKHWFYEGKEKEKEKEGKCSCSCLKEMIFEIERDGFSIGKESHYNNDNHESYTNNNAIEYDNNGIKWSNEHMKIDKSIADINIVNSKVKEKLNGNGSNYNGINEFRETTTSLSNTVYRNHNTTMNNNCYQKYSQQPMSSLSDMVDSQHNKLKSTKKMYEYNYEKQQHHQSQVMLTQNKSFNDLINQYTMFERKTKASTIPLLHKSNFVPYVNNKYFHCENLIYPISKIDYIKTEQMKRMNTLLFKNHNSNTLNL